MFGPAGNAAAAEGQGLCPWNPTKGLCPLDPRQGRSPWNPSPGVVGREGACVAADVLTAGQNVSSDAGPLPSNHSNGWIAKAPPLLGVQGAKPLAGFQGRSP
jgi:hypothetical protein